MFKLNNTIAEILGKNLEWDEVMEDFDDEYVEILDETSDGNIIGIFAVDTKKLTAIHVPNPLYGGRSFRNFSMDKNGDYFWVISRNKYTTIYLNIPEHLSVKEISVPTKPQPLPNRIKNIIDIFHAGYFRVIFSQIDIIAEGIIFGDKDMDINISFIVDNHTIIINGVVNYGTYGHISKSVLTDHPPIVTIDGEPSNIPVTDTYKIINKLISYINNNLNRSGV